MPGRAARFTRACGVAAAGAGAAVLAGWALDVALLKSVAPGYVAMNPATAASFVLAGAALACLPARGRGADRAARACAAAVAAIGLLKLAEVVLGLHLHVDRVLFPGALSAGPGGQPNRMAPNTAAALVLTAAALELARRERARAWMTAQAIAVGVGLLGLFALTGYLYGAPALYDLAPFVPMAVHTATLCLVLAAGIFAARPQGGMAAVVLSPTPAGQMARRMAPAAVLAVIGIGWLRLRGQRGGLFTTETGVALMVVATVLVLLALVWWNARELYAAQARGQAAEAQLRESEARFRAAVDHAPIGMALVSLDGRWLRVNHALAELAGVPAAALLGQRIEQLVRAEPAPLEALHALLPADQGTWGAEAALAAEGGAPVPVQLTAAVVREPTGEPLHFVVQVQDVTERKRFEALLEERSRRDELTGLLNRRGFTELAEHHRSLAVRHGHEMAVLYCDLDGFKRVNDTLGHAAGDEALRAAAALLRRTLRETDLAGRLGGDEFGVLAPETGLDGARRVMRRIQEAFAAAHGRGGHLSPLGMSVGIAVLDPAQPVAVAQLLAAADAQMYVNKRRADAAG